MPTAKLISTQPKQTAARGGIGLIGGLFLSTVVLLSVMRYHDLKQQAEQNLSTVTESLTWNSGIILTDKDGGVDADFPAQLKNNPSILAATLYDAQNRIVATYNPGFLGNDNQPALPNNLQKANNPNLATSATLSNPISLWWQSTFGDTHQNSLASGYPEIIEYDPQGYMHVFRPVLWNNNPLGSLHVTTEFNRSTAFLASCTPIFIGLLLFSALTALLLRFYWQRNFISPLQTLTDTLNAALLNQDVNLVSSTNGFAPLNRLTTACRHLLEQRPETNKPIQPEPNPISANVNQQIVELSDHCHELQSTANAALLAKTKAESANSAKLDFLASLSHEIRTPMSAVLGMADFLWETPLKPEQRNCVEVVRQSSTLLLKIANDILDFAKIETRELVLSKNEFNCAELLRSNFRLLELEAKSKDLKYTLESAVELPYLLIGDSGRLTQILVNLLSNAIKYTAQGEVRLRASCQPRAYRKMRLFCEVIDTGIGIEPNQLTKVFNAFSQNNNPINRIYRGTGLGLALTKQLVQLMGGQIDANSQPGIGSTFWFWVDLSLSDTPIKPIKPQNNYRFKAKLLVAEDYPANQLVVQRFLEDLGCQVHLVSNGFEAVKAIKNNNFDLVFMDCQMPFLDGYQATREIRQLETLRNLSDHIPIIALTAHALNEDETRCREAGMDEWVTKPFTRHDLSKILQKWLPQDLVIADQPTLKTDVKTLAKASNVLDDTSAINMRFFSQQFKLDNIDDLAFISSLTKTFQQNAASILSNLQHSIDDANLENIRKLAHGLKSLSANVGSGKLAELCSAMEHTKDTTEIQYTQEILDSMKQEYLRVLGELNALCSKA